MDSCGSSGHGEERLILGTFLRWNWQDLKSEQLWDVRYRKDPKIWLSVLRSQENGVAIEQGGESTGGAG